MRTLSPAQFQRLIASGAVLVDVRLPEEVAIAALPGALNLPLHDLPRRFAELDPAVAVALFCHHGVRSEHAGAFLEARGFADVSHLQGGIDAWSTQVDGSVPRY